MTPSDIRSLRKRLGLTQQDFAKRLGVSFATVNRWEAGTSKPQRAQMEALRTVEQGPAHSVSSVNGEKSDDPIAIRFQLARKAAGLSFRKAEAQSKVSSPMICRIERGADVGLRTAILLANAYGVSLDWLAGRENRDLPHLAPRRAAAMDLIKQAFDLLESA